jgi:hypothetical protein
MPYAVTHVLVAIIIAELIRDYLVKDKRKFPLHYVLIAGIAGLLPDIDILFYLLVGISPIAAINELSVTSFHPSFTHSLLWIPILLIFAFLFLWFERKKFKEIKKIEKKVVRHHLRISGILFMIALGWATHLLLDGVLSGYVRILFLSQPFGLNLIPPTRLGNVIAAGIDAMLLVLWLIHEELRHRISRFI